MTISPNTTPVILQVDFPFSGPWGDELLPAARTLAESIANEPGLIWKIWTENPDTRRAGGIYLFSDRSSAQEFATMHLKRLAQMGVTDVVYHIFSVNSGLSQLTRAPING